MPLLNHPACEGIDAGRLALTIVQLRLKGEYLRYLFGQALPEECGVVGKIIVHGVHVTRLPGRLTGLQHGQLSDQPLWLPPVYAPWRHGEQGGRQKHFAVASRWPGEAAAEDQDVT